MEEIEAVKDRVYFIDELRGTIIIYVVVYHLIYDIGMFLPQVREWLFSDWVQNIRICCTGMLIVISGVSCQYSHSNLRRGIRTFAIGMIITLVTFLFVPEEIVTFGILHFMGCAMMLSAVMDRILKKIPTAAGLILSAVLFLYSFHIYRGMFSLFGNFTIRLPEGFRLHDSLFFLGISPNGVFSADYYPIVPWIFLFLFGNFAGRIIKDRKAPEFFYHGHSRFLSFAGRHTLMIYLIHQPLFYGIVSFCFQ